MQKANRLGAQDLLEIAAMKGLSVLFNPPAPALEPPAVEPLVGCVEPAVTSGESGSSAGGSVPNAATGQGDSTKAPTTPVAVLSGLDEDAVSHEQNPPDQDAHDSD
jgi:hypothetical protein